MNDECNCDWCGKCQEQLDHQRYIENLRGYGIPAYEDEYGDSE